MVRRCIARLALFLADDLHTLPFAAALSIRGILCAWKRITPSVSPEKKYCYYYIRLLFAFLDKFVNIQESQQYLSLYVKTNPGRVSRKETKFILFP